MVVSDIIEDILKASLNSTISLPTVKESKLDITYGVQDNFITVYNGKEPPLPFAATNLFPTHIQGYRRLTAVDDRCKAVYEVTFNIEGSGFDFRAGDTIGIIPHNDKFEVTTIIEHLNLSSLANLPYTLSINNGHSGGKIPPHIPVKSNIKYVLTHCCDVRAVIKKLFLLALSRHTKDEGERKILEYLCSKEGSLAYTTHVLNKGLCLLDIFSIFKSCKPPIEVLLANLPRLLPRPYSIVNSSIKNSSILKICFSVIDIGNNRTRLVTGWLEKLIKAKSNTIEHRMESLTIDKDFNLNKIFIYIRKNMNGFRPPENIELPLLLIGPGTGICPFIGFLEERHHFRKKCKDKRFGAVWVFFGCRNPKLDFIYERELQAFVNDGTINKLNVSFSRIDNENNKYIQDALLRNGEFVAKLIKEGAFVFVCGDIKSMAAQVRDTIVTCIMSHDGKSASEAEKIISDMQTEKRYVVDVWS